MSYRTFTVTNHGYRTLPSMLQLGSIEALEPKPTTAPLPLQHSISVRTFETMEKRPTIAVKRDSVDSAKTPASASKPPSVSSEDHPVITAQTHESMPQVPAATVKRDSIGAMKATTSMSSTFDHPEITVRSISYPQGKLQTAEVAYTFDRRRSWHWLSYEKLVEKWGKDVITKFNPRFRDGLLKDELISAIIARDKWISTEDEIAGRSSRTPVQQENYWNRTMEELDIMLEGRDAQLKKIYHDILERHQAVKPEENYSVEMLRQMVLQLRKAYK
ncbi:hypothetical protein ZTR_11427 [Talaromyces verruculosus]|nr:hypothetical protein ZTR_11427 [Talaromyces verruculosus]